MAEREAAIASAFEHGITLDEMDTRLGAGHHDGYDSRD
jgi:hypothetical protein